MERANQFWPSRPTAPTVRGALPHDTAEVARLLRTAVYQHRHADWSAPEQWCGRPGSAVYLHGRTLRGYLAAACDPPPVAWLRTVALDPAAPRGALRALLDYVLPRLPAEGATVLACLASQSWLDRELPALDFAATQEIETYLKDEMSAPATPAGRIALRPVEPADFPTLAAMEQCAFADPLWWHSAEQLRLGAQYAACFDVALLDGRLVGFQYSQGGPGDAGHLVRLTVDPAVQGQGVGAALLAAAVTTLRARGLRRLTLNTQVDNLAAQRLYLRFGFRPTGRRYAIWTRPLP